MAKLKRIETYTDIDISKLKEKRTKKVFGESSGWESDYVWNQLEDKLFNHFVNKELSYIIFYSEDIKGCRNAGSETESHLYKFFEILDPLFNLKYFRQRKRIIAILSRETGHNFATNYLASYDQNALSCRECEAMMNTSRYC